MLVRSLRFVAAGAHLCALAGCNVIVGTLAAAQPYYSAGELAHDADARQVTRTAGCLDLALRLAEEEGRTVLEWRMGNRCNDGVDTDLSRVAVTEERRASRTTLRFVDPRHEIGPRVIAPRREAFERIALTLEDARVTVDQVCVDVNGVVAHGASPVAPACFAFDGEWRPSSRPGGAS